MALAATGLSPHHSGPYPIRPGAHFRRGDFSCAGLDDLQVGRKAAALQRNCKADGNRAGGITTAGWPGRILHLPAAGIDIEVRSDISGEERRRYHTLVL